MGGEEDLGFGLDFDIEGVDPGGENSGDPLTAQWVQEVEAGLSQLLEATPLLDHADARLVHARA